MTLWAPTNTNFLAHSQGPWDKHKYIKVVDGKYYYPNSYEDGRTISDLKDDDVDKIAKETIAGKHGNGDDRKAKFGGDYNKIQNRVNELSGNKKRHKDDDEDNKSKEKEKDKDKKEEEEEEEKKTEETKDDDKDKKKKGSGGGSSKKKSDEDKDGKKKGKSSSGKKGSSSKGSGKSEKSKPSVGSQMLKEILKKREQERKQKEKERRRRLNKAYNRDYLNHSGIWAPTNTFHT